MASLCLAKMYDRGLGVEKDQAAMLAWLAWADKNCTPDVVKSYGDEIASMHAFYKMAIDPKVKKRSRAEYLALKLRAGSGK